MGATSQFQHLARIDPTSLQDGEPMSAWRAFATRNNIQHLIDEYHQHRVNWIAKDGGFTPGPKFAQTYLHSVIYGQRPASFYLVVVAGSPEAISANFRTRIVPDSFGFGDESAPSLYDHTAAANFTGGSMQYVILENLPVFITADRPDIIAAAQRPIYGNPTVLEPAIIYPMRIEITWDNGFYEGGLLTTPLLTRCWLREFA